MCVCVGGWKQLKNLAKRTLGALLCENKRGAGREASRGSGGGNSRLESSAARGSPPATQLPSITICPHQQQLHRNINMAHAAAASLAESAAALEAALGGLRTHVDRVREQCSHVLAAAQDKEDSRQGGCGRAGLAVIGHHRTTQLGAMPAPRAPPANNPVLCAHTRTCPRPLHKGTLTDDAPNVNPLRCARWRVCAAPALLLCRCQSCVVLVCRWRSHEETC